MIEESATRFNNGDWYHMKIDTDVPDCKVTGFLDGVPVSFFGECEAGMIEGGSVVWNQIARYEFRTTKPCFGLVESAIASATDESVTITGQANTSYWNDIPSGHKVLLIGDFSMAADSNDSLKINFGGNIINTGVTLQNNVVSHIEVIGNQNAGSYSEIYFYPSTGVVADWTIANLQIFDLNEMFGSDIADMIYSLEQTTAGAGVTLFKTLFAPDDYYEYNAGENMRITLRKTE